MQTATAQETKRAPLTMVTGALREPTHYPMPMAKYGLNPNKENMFRIVLADTVLEMIGGRWADGRDEYRWVKKYDEPIYRNKWILERWRSAMEITHCSAEVYEITYKAPGSELLLNGPYPHRGDYEEVHRFDASTPGEGGIDFLVGACNHIQGQSMTEKRLARQNEYDAERKAEKTANHDRIMDLLPNPNGAAFLKHMKSTAIKSADELGLPTAPGTGILQGA